MPDDSELTTPQAAKQYKIPERTLQAAIKRGELPAQRVEVRGGVYLISPAAMRAFAKTWNERRDARRKEALSGEQEVRRSPTS
jgi:excisionase family DNA binding protein